MVRLTDAELGILRSKAQSAEVSMQRYLLDSALHANRPTAPDMRRSGIELHRLVGEIRRLGTNVNQLAKVANSTGGLPAGVRDAMKSVEAFDDRVTEALTRMEREWGDPT